MASRNDLPRALDVQRFAEARQTEILNLEAIANEHKPAWGIKALPRHLRRRATSHNSYVNKRRPNVKLQEKRIQLARGQTEGKGDAAAKLCNRAMRRRKGRLQQDIVQRAAAGPAAQGSGKPRMLGTHVWHAKRMQMVVRWGHKLASGAPGKGHGSKAFLHTMRHRAVIHDSSYWLSFELHGTAADLLSMLRLLCDPEAVDAFVARAGAHQGISEETLMLHQPSSFPQLAISPVKAIYQMRLEADAALTMEEGREPDDNRLSKVLLFVHAAAHDAALQAVNSAAAEHGVTLQPRYDIQRVEIKGALSDRAVAAALSQADLPWLPNVPTTPRSQASEQLFQLLQATGGATGAELPSGAVLRLRLQDPRLAKPIRALGDSLVEAQGLSSRATSKLPEYREEIKQARGLMKQLSSESLPLVWQPEDVPQPVSEADVSGNRQQRKLAGLHLADTRASALSKVATSCPILLSRQAPKDRKAVPSWTLVIPTGWVCPIWQALVYQGARPAGQTEWHWASMQQGEPFFPQDYPDTQVYAQLHVELRAEQEAQRILRPKGRFTDGTPHPPAWDRMGSIVSTAPAAGAAGAPSVPQVAGAAVAGEVALLSADKTAAEAPLAPSAASSERQADEELAGSAAAGEDLEAGTGGAEHVCNSSSASEAAFGMEVEPMLADEGVKASAEQRNESSLLNMEVDGMQSSNVLPSAQPDSIHAEPPHAEAPLRGTMEAAPMELAPPAAESRGVEGAPHAEHHSDSAAEQAQQHSSHQVPFYIIHSQRVLSSCLQQSPQPRVTDETLPQNASGTNRQQPGTDVRPRCMVHVSLQPIGPGVMQEGAAILALTADEASNIRGCLVNHKVPKKGDETDCTASAGTLKDVLRSIRKQQRDQQHPAPSVPEQGAVPVAMQEEPNSGAAAVAQKATLDDARLLLGFVTSEAPRGVLGRGARAVCDVQLFVSLREQQKPDRQIGGILVAYSSLLSPVLRLAEARPELAVA